MDIGEAENRLFQLKQSMELLDLVTGNPIKEDTKLNITAIETVLNELEKKEKIIDLIVKEFYKKAHISTKCYLQTSIEECLKHKNCINCLKVFFTNKAENVGE